MLKMTNIYVNLNVPRGEVDPKIFGHFCEHAFGNIYGGYYDPGNPNADADGFRLDVIEALKEVAPTIMRYPGGNFVSNYHWEDGIGPKENRKKVFEYAWLTEESNQFGTADFIELCRRVGAEPLICVNMGTGTIEEAMHWIEYCNGTGDTYYANLRRSHGYEEPFGVKYWGLGNESYGPWQMNNYTAEEYADKAFQFAKALKWVDPTIKLVACGYEQITDWNVTVVKKLWQMIDYISAHHYSCVWGPFNQENYLETMCIGDYMEKLHKMTCSAITAGMNDTASSIKVAWDEWNFNGWALENAEDDKAYTLQNALVTALILNMFIRNGETIGMANYSTFVNITGALSVTEQGIVRRAQFPVFELLRHQTGKQIYQADVVGESYSVKLPQSQKLGREKISIDLLELFSGNGGDNHRSSYVDAAVTGDEDGTIYVSLVNKHPEEDMEVSLHFFWEKEVTSLEDYTIYAEEIDAANTADRPDTIKVQKLDSAATKENRCDIVLKKHSINVLKFKK